MSNFALIAFVAAQWLGPAGSSLPGVLPRAEARAADKPAHARPSSPIVDVAGEVSPSVVTVGTVATRRELVRNPMYWDFFNQYAIRNVKERIPYLGSGALVSSEGHIVTNYHVVQQGESSFVTLMDGREFPAKLIDGDPYIDIAVLKIDADNLPEPMQFGDSDALQIGETVLALGNPFGPMIADPRPTVTAGVVSAVHRRFQPDIQSGKVYQDMIQTDAAINPGNSGGPLVDLEGRLMGINTFIFSSSGGSHGIGFAIPAARVKRIVDEVREYGHVRQLWLDFGFTLVRGRDFQGALVESLVDDGPAAKSGLRVGDIIVEADGHDLRSGDDLELYFLGKQIGEKLKLTIYRGDQSSDLTYQITAAPLRDKAPNP